MKFRNWWVTVAGILAGAPGIIATLTPILPPKWAAVLSGIGAVLTGLFAKGADEK